MCGFNHIYQKDACSELNYDEYVNLKYRYVKEICIFDSNNILHKKFGGTCCWCFMNNLCQYNICRIIANLVM